MTALLADLVARHPDEPALVDDRGITTWGQLDQRVTRLVHALRDRGLHTGDAVAALLGNQRELIEVTLACAHGGWLLVPLNWHWVPREVAYVLSDADARAVIVDERWTAVMVDAIASSDSPAPGIRVAVGEAAALDDFERYEDVLGSANTGDIDDPQRGGPMFYTSGTTGSPKGVRSALSAIGGPPEVFTLIAHTMAPTIGITPGERHVQLICGPLYHSAQWAIAMFALASGTTVVLQHRFDAAELLELIDTHDVTNVHLVPTQMVRLLDLPDANKERFDGSSLRQILHGAAPCAPSVKRRMIEWVGPIVAEYYGGTEGGFLARIEATDWLERPGSVGRPLDLVEVVVLDEGGQPVGPNQPGDIWFRSRVGSDFEYHKAPDKTAGAHRENGFGTLGDIGFFDDDGFLYLSDRKIDMVVSGGVNIYPAEIEGVLCEHPAVADVAVFGVPDHEMGESVHAALALRPGTAWTDTLGAELDAFCRARLAGYKVPRSFEVHEALPRSEAGKLTKRQLRDPWWIGTDRSI